MKKFLLALVVLGGVTFNSFAQSADGGKFSIGLEAGLPVGDASDVFSLAIGGSLKYDIPVADKLFATVSAGYTSLVGKTITIPGFGTGKVNALGVVPVKAGLKYFFSEGFFGEAQVGAAIYTSEGNGTAFAWSPGVGYAFPGGFQLGVRYESWAKNGGSVDQAALRLAYAF